MYFYDDINCAETPCTANDDCGFPEYRYYCRKPG